MTEKRISGLAALLCLVAVGATAQENIRFTDDFSNGLGGWVLIGATWTASSGQMWATFEETVCYHPWCSGGDLLLTDANQPRTHDWRMEVDVRDAGGAPFSIWATSKRREIAVVGQKDAASATFALRSFAPETIVAQGSGACGWQVNGFNHVTLEKRASTYTFSVNGSLLGTASQSIAGDAKLGLHVDRWAYFKNFKLTEIGVSSTYAIRGTVRTPNGKPLSRVTVTTSPATASAVTDANGTYSLIGLSNRTSYTIAPAYSDAFGTWTFSQPLALRTISGSDIGGVDFVSLPPGTQQEVTRYGDDFSTTLAQWVVPPATRSSTWSIRNGRLFGEYDIICGNPTCNQSDLLLADENQPRTADWRMEVDFTYVDHFWGDYHDSNVMFLLYNSDLSKENYCLGWDQVAWDGAPRSTIKWYRQSYDPQWLTDYWSIANLQWSPKASNRARLEKRGDVMLFYLNGQFVAAGVATGLRNTPKLGVHIYGTTSLDNFKLTELAPPAAADLSIIKRARGNRYTISVHNGGPGVAAPVTVTHMLGPGERFAAYSGPPWTCALTGTGIVTCMTAAVPLGDAPTLTIWAGGGAGATVSEVWSAMVDPDWTNNRTVATEFAESVPVADGRTMLFLAAALALVGSAFMVRRG